MFDETIAAVATPPGKGGVGIVRLSGPCALAIALALSQKKLIAPRQAYFSSFYTQEGELIDQGILLYFKAPNSFTGEDTIEIQAHGSPVVLDQLLEAVFHLGARAAIAGEFSKRAFLNGKMDLTQAEAVADLIDAASKQAAKMALRSLSGAFSKEVHQLCDALIHLRVFVEAAIDFPEEEIDFLSDGHVLNLLNGCLKDLDLLFLRAKQGVLMREGSSLVIAGKPNVGKSTLMNQLAGQDLAIVTDVAGTTRDVMRTDILLDDIPIHLIDTAGLRESNCIVEQEGIKRARIEIEQADCILLMIDAAEEAHAEEIEHTLLSSLAKDIPRLRLFNKIDCLGLNPSRKEHSIYLSAQNGEGLSLLKESLKELLGAAPEAGYFIARRRHLSALMESKNLLLQARSQLQGPRAAELLAEDLRLAQQALGRITGEFSADDLLGSIFSSFCIGK